MAFPGQNAPGPPPPPRPPPSPPKKKSLTGTAPSLEMLLRTLLAYRKKLARNAPGRACKQAVRSVNGA